MRSRLKIYDLFLKVYNPERFIFFRLKGLKQYDPWGVNFTITAKYDHSKIFTETVRDLITEPKMHTDGYHTV